MNFISLIAALVSASLFVCSAWAQTTSVATDPVGFIPVSALGNSDTYISTPLHRPALFRGTLLSEQNGLLTMNLASFTDDQLNGRYYVLVASGARAGRWYTITDTTAPNQLLIARDGEDLSADLVNGTRVMVIPFWTLNTVLPEGQGVHASNTFAPKTWVLTPDQSSSGIKLATEASFFYYNGSDFQGEGWRKAGALPSVKFDDQILFPDSHFIVRHQIAQATTIVCPGAVQMTEIATKVRTLLANTPQDNALSFNAAVPATLSASRLYESGAFTASATIDTPADQLLVFDNDSVGTNKVPSETYYYFSGATNGGPGWRLLAPGASNVIKDAELVFKPAKGYVLRKVQSASVGQVVWKMKPSYVP